MSEKGDLVKQKIDELGIALQDLFGDNAGNLMGILTPLKMAVDQYEQVMESNKNDHT